MTRSIRGLRSRIVATIALAITVVLPFGAAQAHFLRPITWNVVGLDSNNVDLGPARFPVGVRICAQASALSNHKAQFSWLSANAFVSLSGGASAHEVSLDIPADTCRDVFYEVALTRSEAAYRTTRRFEIEIVSAAGTPLVPALKTPPNREIYVEALISQNRNRITGFSYNGGPELAPGSTITVGVGQTFDLEMRSTTASQGYDQVANFIALDPALFRINRVASTFSANAGTDPDAATKVYADGCGWINDYTDVHYHTSQSCTGAGKYGGTMTHRFNVTVIAAPSVSGAPVKADALIYDYSGSSYHYNRDSATGGVSFIFSDPPPPVTADVGIVKTVTADSAGSLTFSLAVSNAGPGSAAGVVVTDSIPASCFTVDNNQGAGWPATVDAGTNTITWAIGTLAAGASRTLTIKANRLSQGTGCVNTATVTSATPDLNPANNASTVAVNEPLADLAITKVVNGESPHVGDSVVFKVRVTNRGPAAASDVIVVDAVPAGYSVSGSSASVGTYAAPNWTIGALPSGAAAELAITATVQATGSYLNTAIVSAGTRDIDPSNNSASAAAPPAYLDITKATSSKFMPGGAGTFTVTVSKTAVSSLGLLTVADVAPPGMTITGMAGPGWSCVIETASCTRQDDVTAVGGFPIAYPSITVTVRIAPPPVASPLTNRATVASSLAGAYAETSLAVATDDPPDLAVSLAGMSASATVGYPYAGSFTCANVGDADAVESTTCAISGLPVGVAMGACAITPSSVPWTAGSVVPVGAVVSCSVSGTPTTEGTATVVGTTSAVGDFNLVNNTASLLVTVRLDPPDMAVSLAGLPVSGSVGALYSGFFTCTNVGDAVAAAGTTCSVSGLPAGVTPNGCSIDLPTAGAWAAGSAIPVGAVVTCSVLGTPTAEGSTSIVGTTGSTGDPNPANDTATLVVMIAGPQPIPTLSAWGLAVLGLLVAGLARRGSIRGS